jgi:hypothetical protein
MLNALAKVTLAYQPKHAIGFREFNADILVSLRVDADLSSPTTVGRPRDAIRQVKRRTRFASALRRNPAFDWLSPTLTP